MSAAERPPVTSLLGLAASLARQWWPQVAALAAACGVVATTISGASVIVVAWKRAASVMIRPAPPRARAA